MESDTRKRRKLQGIALAAAGLAVVIAVAAAVAIPSAASSPHAVPVDLSVVSSEPPVTVSPEARQLLEGFSSAFEHSAKLVDQSVVPILSEQKVGGGTFTFGPGSGMQGQDPQDLLRRFFNFVPREAPQQTLHSLGSGVIVSDDGYILTNSHVVQDSEKLTVITPDNERHSARIIGADPESDLAVIKIDASNLVPAVFGNSDQLRVGQWVIAVGNPMEMLHSVTAGIVSATGRSSVGIADYEDFIQTDASINPGNSGGALADLDGRVVGINTAIASPTGANVGIGFAIPINMAANVMNELIQHGAISRGYLGVVIQDLNGTLSKALNLDETHGALVGDVTPDGPAAQAGIERGDVIVRFDGRDVENASELRNQVAAISPGSRVEIGILRQGHTRQLTATLGERPSPNGQPARGEDSGQSQHHLGLSVQDLTPDIAARLGYQNAKGALVAGVEQGSPAEQAGLQRGDLIVEVGTTPIGSAAELGRAIAAIGANQPVALLVRRGENTFYVAIQGDESGAG